MLVIKLMQLTLQKVSCVLQKVCALHSICINILIYTKNKYRKLLVTDKNELLLYLHR